MFEDIKDKLPEYICRKDVKAVLTPYFGHVYSTKYLANLDSKGKGPKNIAVGRKIYYKREDFLAWLEQRTTC